jgi:5'-3' exonuclease
MFILIDGHSMAYRTWHGSSAIQRQANSEGLFAYSLVNQMMGAVREVEKWARAHIDPAFIKPAVCWDTPTSRGLRRKLHSEYKAKRKKPERLPEYLGRFKKAMAGVHPRYGLEHPDYEADDFIAYIAICLFESCPVVIISRDTDLQQLLIEDACTVYDPLEKIFIGYSDFKRKHGFGPEYIPLWKATVGDTADNWPGIKGFGDKTWLKFMADATSPKQLRKTLEATYDPAVIKLGLDLVHLPIASNLGNEVANQFLSAIDNESPAEWEPLLERYNISAINVAQLEGWLI